MWMGKERGWFWEESVRELRREERVKKGRHHFLEGERVRRHHSRMRGESLRSKENDLTRERFFQNSRTEEKVQSEEEEEEFSRGTHTTASWRETHHSRTMHWEPAALLLWRKIQHTSPRKGDTFTRLPLGEINSPRTYRASTRSTLQHQIRQPVVICSLFTAPVAHPDCSNSITVA